MQSRQTRFPWLGHGSVFCLIALFTFSPLFWLAIANAQAPGAPIGLTDLMASWGVLGWLVMTPFALGPMLFMAWAAVVVLHLLIFLRRKGKAR